MNARDFISPAEYERCKDDAFFNQPFIFKKELKVKGNIYKFKLDGRWHDSWINNGKDFHAFLNFDYFCKNDVGGWGGSIELETYDEFIANLNERLKRFKDYNDAEQFTLF